MSTQIPLVDLTAQYKTIKPQIDSALADVVERAHFVNGSALHDFERAFARFCGIEHAIGVGSGTAALHLALLSLDIGPGDEVILPAHTFIATVEPVVWLGARPVFADIDPVTYTLDSASVERCLSDRTKAIIPVHLYGQMADMAALRSLVDDADTKIAIIEDAAQAHGAQQNGKRAGAHGDLACFSFFPGKNLGAYGDGGVVTTSDASMAQRIRMLRNHGRSDKYRHDVIGYNYRLDTIQAAILGVKLTHLDTWNERRRARAAWFSEQLADLPGVTLPHIASGNESVYHLYVIEVDDRDSLREYLAADGIATGIHYPIPLHQQPALRPVDFRGDALPVTQRAAGRILSLPIYAELTDEQATRIVGAIHSFFAEAASSADHGGVASMKTH